MLNGLPAGDLNIDIAPRSLAYSVPRYDDEIPRGQTGVTIPNRKPGAKKIDTVYNEELTQELYDAIADRAKWFTRVYVTPGQNNHIMFFFETTCLYAAPTQDVRIPGVIRGPDSVQGHLPDGVDPVVTDDTYLVPVHMLPDRYWEQSQKCADCDFERVITIEATASYGSPSSVSVKAAARDLRMDHGMHNPGHTVNTESGSYSRWDQEFVPAT